MAAATQDDQEEMDEEKVAGQRFSTPDTISSAILIDWKIYEFINGNKLSGSEEELVVKYKELLEDPHQTDSSTTTIYSILMSPKKINIQSALYK